MSSLCPVSFDFAAHTAPPVHNTGHPVSTDPYRSAVGRPVKSRSYGSGGRTDCIHRLNILRLLSYIEVRIISRVGRFSLPISTLSFAIGQNWAGSCFLRQMACVRLQDVKMKRLAARHVTSTTSVHSRQAVHRQLRQWDNNLDRLRLTHYRFACYVASLYNVEQPNSLVLQSCSLVLLEVRPDPEPRPVVTQWLGCRSLTGGLSLPCA